MGVTLWSGWGSGAGHGPGRLMCWLEMLRLNCQLRPDSEVSDVTKGVRGLAKGRWLRSCRVFFFFFLSLTVASKVKSRFDTAQGGGEHISGYLLPWQRGWL